jgi:hypothetical protein
VSQDFYFPAKYSENVLSLPVKTGFTTFEGKNTKTGFHIQLFLFASLLVTFLEHYNQKHPSLVIIISSMEEIKKLPNT